MRYSNEIKPTHRRARREPGEGPGASSLHLLLHEDADPQGGAARIVRKHKSRSLPQRHNQWKFHFIDIDVNSSVSLVDKISLRCEI